MTVSPDNWCPPSAEQPDPRAEPSGPQLLPPKASALCSRGWQPILITGLLRDVLIRHFSAPSGIREPDLRNLIWQPGNTTGILIESLQRWRGELVDKRPAVILKTNARQNFRPVWKNLSGETPQGQRDFTTFWIGSHTLFCLNGSGASTEILATEVETQLTEFSQVLQESLGLFRFQVVEVGEASKIEESRVGWAIPVVVGWAYEHTWRTELESLKVRKIPLSFLVR